MVLRVWLVLACAALISVRLLCFIIFDRLYEVRHRKVFWAACGVFVLLDVFLIIWTLMGTLWYQSFISSEEGAKTETQDRWELPLCFVICDIITLVCTAVISNRLIALCMTPHRVSPIPTVRVSMRSLQESLNSEELEELQRRVMEYQGDGSEACSICFELLVKNEKTLELPECHHVFHSQCLLEWARRKAVCPYCRNNISQALDSDF